MRKRNHGNETIRKTRKWNKSNGTNIIMEHWVRTWRFRASGPAVTAAIVVTTHSHKYTCSPVTAVT